MTTRTPLSEYLAQPDNTQTGLAKAVGVTQGAIHQMLRSERSIFVVENEDGSVHLEEHKRLGNAAA